MTSYKDLLVLLNDIEAFAETQDFPRAESLISEARMAIESDMHSEKETRTRDIDSLASFPMKQRSAWPL